MASINGMPPPRKPWIVLGFKFKKEWEAALKAILHDTPHGQEIVDHHHTCVMAALSCHPEVAQKVGAGVHHFETGPGPDKFGSTCFHLVRVDGTRETFSLKVCLSGKPNPWACFCEALRDVVSLDILDWKNRHRETGCALCGCMPTGRDLHADHAYPFTFNTLANEFVEDCSIDLDHIEYADDPMWKLADREIREQWRGYHRARAVLWVLCGACNSRIGSRSAA